MAYTSNVPQANQTIASTTTPIRNNFTFINTDLQVDHSFNGNSTGAEGTHLQCRMKGQGSPPTLLTNNNGAYYVDTATPGNAQFYDGTNSYKMNLWRDIITGTVTFSSINTNTLIGLAPGALPNQVFGVIYFYGPTSGINTTNIVCCQNVFVTTSSQIVSQPLSPTSAQPIAIKFGDSINSVRAFVTTADELATYWWTLVYRNRQ